MCSVHLVPDVDEIRLAKKAFSCGECGKIIRKGKPYRHVEGQLDDGSGERFRYRAHEDCFLIAETDVGEDGCFQYGGAEPLTRGDNEPEQDHLRTRLQQP